MTLARWKRRHRAAQRRALLWERILIRLYGGIENVPDDAKQFLRDQGRLAAGEVIEDAPSIDSLPDGSMVTQEEVDKAAKAGE